MDELKELDIELILILLFLASPMYLVLFFEGTTHHEEFLYILDDLTYLVDSGNIAYSMYALFFSIGGIVSFVSSMFLMCFIVEIINIMFFKKDKSDDNG